MALSNVSYVGGYRCKLTTVGHGRRISRMNDALGNALVIEMEDLFAKDEVL